jgi:hypothetical protein
LISILRLIPKAVSLLDAWLQRSRLSNRFSPKAESR